MYKRLIVLVFSCLLLTWLVACSNGEKDNETTEQENQPTDVEEIEEPVVEEEPEEPEEPETVTQEISIAAVGDILVHSSVYEDARTESGYDFMPMFENVKPFLDDTTITIANQETMIGGTDLGLSTYPRFNSPYEVGDALKGIGVDVVSIANNHTLDRGEQAVQNAISHWEKIDMMYTGAYKDDLDRQNIRVMETEEGIDVAFLSFTYGTNGIPVPEGKDYLVNLIDQEKIVADIEAAKKLSDVVILSLHFGTEYQRMPNQEQIDLVQLAADHGVTAVIGHHPHVLQPVDWVEGKNGNKTFVSYSLGNFISAQDEFYRQIGGVVQFDIEVTTTGEEKTVEVQDPKFLPTYVKYQNWSNYQVLPMYQLTDEDLPNAAEHYEEIKQHMSQLVPELTFIESE
ncbi:CapA family protein [Radiobacillus sp. PE A8.2]|uniref:CapA family protein n=1 Tax=Radiobacillus sp. PE A8.2 TaxID=3380349 RepID=UPI0038900E28